jgi:hypothetical protein
VTVRSIFHEIASAIDDKPIDEVMPVLITASARLLVIQADGDMNRLSTLLLKFCRIVQNEAADMMEKKEETIQ